MKLVCQCVVFFESSQSEWATPEVSGLLPDEISMSMCSFFESSQNEWATPEVSGLLPDEIMLSKCSSIWEYPM